MNTNCWVLTWENVLNTELVSITRKQRVYMKHCGESSLPAHNPRIRLSSANAKLPIESIRYSFLSSSPLHSTTSYFWIKSTYKTLSTELAGLSADSEKNLESGLWIDTFRPKTLFPEVSNDLNYKSLLSHEFSQSQKNDREMTFPESESFCVNLFLKQTTHSILNGLFFVTNILLESKWNRIKLRKILHNLPIIPHVLAHLAGPIKLRQVASRKGNRNDFHSGGKSSLHSQRRVFEHDTMLWRNSCDRSGFQEDVRSGLSVFNIFSCHDRLEAVDHFLEIDQIEQSIPCEEPAWIQWGIEESRLPCIASLHVQRRSESTTPLLSASWTWEQLPSSLRRIGLPV